MKNILSHTFVALSFVANCTSCAPHSVISTANTNADNGTITSGDQTRPIAASTESPAVQHGNSLVGHLFSNLFNSGSTTGSKNANDTTSDNSNGDNKQRAFSADPLTIKHADTQADQFISQLSMLADQLEKSIDRSNIANTFIVTSFVNIDKLDETSSFGRLISENLIYELNVRHWKVFDVRLTKGITINESGEFSLSRDGEKIRDAYKVGGIVVGTYSAGSNHVIVNARVIDIESGVVITAGQIHLPANQLTDELLHNSAPRNVKTTIKIVGGANDK